MGWGWVEGTPLSSLGGTLHPIWRYPRSSLGVLPVQSWGTPVQSRGTACPVWGYPQTGHGTVLWTGAMAGLGGTPPSWWTEKRTEILPSQSTMYAGGKNQTTFHQTMDSIRLRYRGKPPQKLVVSTKNKPFKTTKMNSKHLADSTEPVIKTLNIVFSWWEIKNPQSAIAFT